MTAAIRLLIIGGYGSFGGRLARLLADEPRILLLIGGRSMEKARAFCAELGGGAEPVVFDRDGDVAAGLSACNPAIAVDASGPFQTFGPRPYRIAEACIAQGISYLDLADGTDFVTGIGTLDAAAREAGVFVLSGVSTLPALSFAALRHLQQGLATVETVTGGIAPSPKVEMGLNVMRAIAGYAGKPVKLLRDSRPATGTAMVDTFDFTISPPGALPLARRRFALVDVPDLALMPQALPGLQSVWFGAGTEPAILQRLLSLLSRLVKAGLVSSLLPVAGLMHRVGRMLRYGDHRGGMFLKVAGNDAQGVRHEKCWHLIAEGEHGPFIPAMASEAILRRCVTGQKPEPGARHAADALALADFAPLFSRLDIVSGVTDVTAEMDQKPLYRRVLGTAFETLPAAVAALHDHTESHRVSGLAQVERGASPLARLTAWVVGFPKAGIEIPVSVQFDINEDREIWTRTFGGKSFASTQAKGTGRNAGLLIETFGPFDIQIALVPLGGRLQLVIRGWRLFGLRLPRFLAPGGTTFEHEADGRFHFHVEIASPITGLIVRYRGFLTPDPEPV
ncbi:SDR family oxidoreductase [Pararhizobium sp.]|uniref:SDR family oxidoreductase n=1 Tax=Pararhizobium sp. TaxID=1977563 RepID=UPI00271FA153|nr:DUF4166 domain-containing protein [Pararhizobium sp.]MDO9415810.1 DUF4166 domain-containing protein [Pararhizobium sp.]